MRLTILHFSVLCIIVWERSEARRRACSINDDCPSKRCCVSFLQPNGTEQPWAKKVNQLTKEKFKGVCRPYSRKGAGCNQFQVYPDDDSRLNFNRCQCAKNLYCEDQNVNAPEGYVGVCSAENSDCNNVTMCKSDECCVSDYGIVGQNEGPGSCQTMGKPGDRCLIKNGAGRPEGMVPYSCPCMDNHVCGKVDVIEARFGSIGRCVLIKEST